MATVFTPTRTRLTVDQFNRMGEAGILPPDARIELIDGEMLEMAPIGSRHFTAVNRLNRFLVSALGDAAVVSIQHPVVLDDYSEPQPDVTVLKPEVDEGARLPTVSDVILLIEVSDSTLQFDRTIKLQLYAERGIAEVWIVNLVDHLLEIYREPNKATYRVKLEKALNDSVSPAALPHVELALAEILNI